MWIGSLRKQCCPRICLGQHCFLREPINNVALKTSHYLYNKTLVINMIIMINTIIYIKTEGSCWGSLLMLMTKTRYQLTKKIHHLEYSPGKVNIDLTLPTNGSLLHIPKRWISSSDTLLLTKFDFIVSLVCNLFSTWKETKCSVYLH